MKLLTVTQTCEELQLCQATVYRLIAEGKLRAMKVGRATRILAANVSRFVEEGVKAWKNRYRRGPGVRASRRARNAGVACTTSQVRQP